MKFKNIFSLVNSSISERVPSPISFSKFFIYQRSLFYCFRCTIIYVILKQFSITYDVMRSSRVNQNGVCCMFASWRNSRNSFVALLFVLLVTQVRLNIVLRFESLKSIKSAIPFHFRRGFLLSGNVIEF